MNVVGSTVRTQSRVSTQQSRRTDRNRRARLVGGECAGEKGDVCWPA